VLEKTQVAGERRVSRAAGMFDVLSLTSAAASQSIYCRVVQENGLRKWCFSCEILKELAKSSSITIAG